MNKVEITHYPIVGSSALKPEYTEGTIDYPLLPEEKEGRSHKDNILHRAKDRAVAYVMQTDSVQDLLHGSLQGKSFNQTEGWKTLVMGCSLFIIAIACLYLGQ